MYLLILSIFYGVSFQLTEINIYETEAQCLEKAKEVRKHAYLLEGQLPRVECVYQGDWTAKSRNSWEREEALKKKG